MSRLKFEDIDEWTPSSISIVDVPAHPLCKFEVYDDDNEFVTKSIEIQNEGEIMVEPQNQEEPMMTVSEGFFERMLNRVVGKSEEKEEPTKEEPAKETDVDIQALVARVEKLEAEVADLKKEEETKEPEEENEAPAEAVAKSESEGETSEATNETTEEPEVVMKSRSLDPDTITTETTDKSLVERAGRNSNGMTW